MRSTGLGFGEMPLMGTLPPAGLVPQPLQSPGARQHCTIPTALALQPDLTILDELLSAVDVLVENQIFKL